MTHDAFRLSPGAPVARLGMRKHDMRALSSGPVTSLGNRAPSDRYAITFNGTDEFLEASKRVLETDIVEMTVSIWYRVSVWGTYIICCEWPSSGLQDSFIVATAPANGGFPTSTPSTTTRVYINAPGSAGFAITEHPNSAILNDWIQLVYVYHGGRTGNDNIAQMWRARGQMTHLSRLSGVTHDFASGGLVAYPTAIQRPTTSFFCIGARGDQPTNNKTDYFSGQIAEIAWFNRALDHREIQMLRDGQFPADLNRHPRKNDLYYWFKMGDVKGDVFGRIKNVAPTPGGMTMIATGSNMDSGDIVPWRRSG